MTYNIAEKPLKTVTPRKKNPAPFQTTCPASSEQKRLLYNTALALGLLFNSHVFHLRRVAGLADRASLHLDGARRRVLVVLDAAVGAAGCGVQLRRLLGRLERAVGVVHVVRSRQGRRRATRRGRYRLAALDLLDYRIGLAAEVATGLEGVVPAAFRAGIKKIINQY